MYDITTGTGDFIANGVVSHNCFARPTHTYLDFDAGRDFEREIVVKVNAPEVLRVELARPSWRGEHVALGTNTDPYQWVEGRYRLMEGIWEAMRDAGNPCSILTKSPLLLRDLGLMGEIAARTEFSAALSIPTIDERAWRETEPHTPNPRARLEAVRGADAGRDHDRGADRAADAGDQRSAGAGVRDRGAGHGGRSRLRDGDCASPPAGGEERVLRLPGEVSPGSDPALSAALPGRGVCADSGAAKTLSARRRTGSPTGRAHAGSAAPERGRSGAEDDTITGAPVLSAVSETNALGQRDERAPGQRDERAPGQVTAAARAATRGLRRGGSRSG